MRPAYITATRSQVWAITPMSCETSTMDIPVSSRISRRRTRIWSWIVTSSAVVGSSASSSRGRPEHRDARSSPAGACRRRARAGRPSAARRQTGSRPDRASAIARSRASRCDDALAAASALRSIWCAHGEDGFSELVGSWKIMATSPAADASQISSRSCNEVAPSRGSPRRPARRRARVRGRVLPGR